MPICSIYHHNTSAPHHKQEITGKTVTDIIAKLVITDAEAKLKSTDLTIQEIAYSLNFPDISFFGKYFKRYTGMSPKQYRENVE